MRKTRHMPTRGKTLRVQRFRQGVKQTELARAMGVHRNSVIRYEGLAEVPPEVVEAYLAALASLRPEQAATVEAA